MGLGIGDGDADGVGGRGVNEWCWSSEDRSWCKSAANTLAEPSNGSWVSSCMIWKVKEYEKGVRKGGEKAESLQVSLTDRRSSSPAVVTTNDRLRSEHVDTMNQEEENDTRSMAANIKGRVGG